jgi:hypothetical protein
MEIIDIADAALYQAKIDGKNRIRTPIETRSNQQSGLHLV